MYTRVQIIDEAVAVYTCAHCLQMMSIAAWGLTSQPDNKLELVCGHCGHMNPSVIENRKSRRKRTDIAGVLKAYGGGRREYAASMRIVDMSWQGFKLLTGGCACGIMPHDTLGAGHKGKGREDLSIFTPHCPAAGERITIEFFLGDAKNAYISRGTMVRWVRDDSLGVELCRPDAMEPSIRFFLTGLPPL